MLVVAGIVLSSLYRAAVERAFDRRLNVYLRTLVADVATPVVRLHSIGRSRDYDEARLSAAKRILEKHRDDMVSSRKERAKYQAIAAVNAARLGRWPEARRFAWQASRTQPMRLRNHARSAVMTYRSACERVTHEAH